MPVDHLISDIYDTLQRPHRKGGYRAHRPRKLRMDQPTKYSRHAQPWSRQHLPKRIRGIAWFEDWRCTENYFKSTQHHYRKIKTP